MTSLPDSGPDLLAFARQQRRVADRAEADILIAAAAWADQHASDSIVPAMAHWETASPLAGEGTPEVAEFCIAEFAAVLGLTTQSGSRVIGDALELRHRLPKLWARVEAGEVQAWRARKVAQATIALPPEGAAFVDQHVASFAQSIGFAQLERLIEEARVRFVDGYERKDGPDAPDRRRVQFDFDQLTSNGTVQMWGELDLADAADVEKAVTRRAGQLGDLGADLGPDARRAIALGEIARDELTLDLETGERGAPAGTSTELKVHVSADDLDRDDDTGLARVEGTGGAGAFVKLTTVRSWLQRPDARIAVRGVIDTAATIRIDQWEIPDRLRRQVTERDGTCRFPFCNHPAQSSDIDHIEPYDTGPDGSGGPAGQTSSDNTAPACRRHHRLKTHGRWSYTMLEPGYYLWRSPTGHRFLVGPTGTRIL